MPENELNFPFHVTICFLLFNQDFKKETKFGISHSLAKNFVHNFKENHFFDCLSKAF